MALRNLGADFERYRVVEFDKYAIASYNAVHGTDFPTMDIQDVHGEDLTDDDSDKYTTIMTYSFPCFTGDTLVLTQDGYKCIKDIKVGEYVYTHKNRFRQVTESKETGNHTIINVRTSAQSVSCTKNHLFYTSRMDKSVVYEWENNKAKYVRTDYSIKDESWKRADELEDGDYVLYPYIMEEIPYFSDDENLWYIAGRYLADGSWRKPERNKHGKITISCNEKKLNELEKRVKNTGMKYKTRKGTTCLELDIYEESFRTLIRNDLGVGSKGKFVSYNILALPKNLLQQFLDGYISGDGTITNDGVRFYSVNQKIITAIQQMCCKLYKVIPSITLIKEKEKKVICGVECNANDYYSGFYNLNAKYHSAFRMIDGRMWVKYKATSEKTPEMTFEISVDEDHSFTANGNGVHNCTDISVAGQMKGLAEGSGTRSSLLWECRRILDEMNTIERLPEILLLENVTAIHSQDNMPHFQKWLDFLETLGYSSFVQDLNASDYGIAQNRDRTFVVSILGEWNYHFPEPIELTTCIEDYFEDLTDEQALQLVVKSDKALKLLKELDDEDKLE